MREVDFEELMAEFVHASDYDRSRLSEGGKEREFAMQRLRREHAHLYERCAALLADNDALVLVQVAALDSSKLGMGTVIAVGPGRTFTSVESVKGPIPLVVDGKVFDLPSCHQWPRCFTRNQER